MAAAVASSYVPPSSMASPYDEPPEAPAPPDGAELRPRARGNRAAADNQARPGRSRTVSTNNARRRLLAVARDAVVQAAEAEDEAEQALDRAATLEEQQAARVLQAEAEAMARDAEYLMRKAEAKMQRRTDRTSPPAFSPSPPAVREDAPVPTAGRASRGADISVRSDDTQQSTSGRLHTLTGSTPRRTLSGAPLQPISVNVSNSSRDSRQSINLSACSRGSARECVNVSSLSRDAARAREAKARSARTVLHPSQENVTQFEVQGHSVGSDGSINTSRSNTTAPPAAKGQARAPTPPEEPRTAPGPKKAATATNPAELEGLLAMIANVLGKSGMNPAELARKAGVVSASHNLHHNQLRELLDMLGVNVDTAVLVQLLESLGIEKGSISLPVLIEKASTPNATGNGKAAESDSWQCSLCTKSNEAAASACVVCKRERGHVASARPTRRVLRHEAAVKMQSSYRGYATRKVLRTELDLSAKSAASAVGGVDRGNWSGSVNPDGPSADADVSDELQAAVQRLEKQMPDPGKSCGPLDDDHVVEKPGDEPEGDNSDSDGDDGGGSDETDEEQEEEDEPIFFGIASTKHYSQAQGAEEDDNLDATIQEAQRTFVEATREADRYDSEAVEAEKRMLDESVAWEEAQHKSTVAAEECRRLSMEARDEAVRRSKKEAEEARAAKREAAMLKAKQEAEAAEQRAQEIAARRKKMEDEKRKAADAAQAARKRATEAAEKEQALRKQQEQRVKDLRQAEAASTKLAADKQQLISQLERRLQSKIAGCTGSQRFVGILKAFSVPCENNEQATVQKAYRKALIKYHPDKAQRKGEGWQKVVESEEIYKLIQNEWQKYEKQPTRSSNSGYAPKAPARSPPRRTPAAHHSSHQHQQRQHQYQAPRPQHAPTRPPQPQPQQHYQRYARPGQSQQQQSAAPDAGPSWKCRVCTKVRTTLHAARILGTHTDAYSDTNITCSTSGPRAAESPTGRAHSPLPYSFMRYTNTP